jgi:putative Holliday junction resolvase
MPVPSPRIVAVDYGKRRVGLAVADPLRIFAQPFGTFSPGEALEQLASLARRDGLAVIVVGWPLTEAGQEGEATAFVAAYIDRLRAAFPQAEIVRWDERFTSEAAKAALRGAGLRYRDRRGRSRVDATAAAILLQEYLDR